jgi:PAS domain S-box-containing protein
MKENILIMRKIIDNVQDGVLVIDRKFKIIFANRVFLEYFGVSEDTIIGEDCRKISKKYSIPCSSIESTCLYDEIIKKGESKTIIPIYHPKERNLEITGTTILDDEGEVVNIIEIFRDITERVKSEIFFSSVIEGIKEGILVISPDFKITFANRAYLDQEKRVLEEIRGMHCYEVSHSIKKPCYEEGEECPTKYSFDTGKEWISIHNHFDREGNKIWVEIKTYPLKDNSGKVFSVIEVINDITDRKKSEEELIKRIRELEEFYELAVGRELRMMELKEEIEKLKSELKKYKNNEI